jgi:hydrogenase maturation protein HypF
MFRFGSERIRVRGIVQGVGFRPMVWAVANKCGAKGFVRNDGQGVLIEVHARSIDKFVASLREQCPPMAHINSIEREQITTVSVPDEFSIEDSLDSDTHTHIPADAATCLSCLYDINNQQSRRYRYAFTNCTHCGPRLSIIDGIPYDREQTTMSAFTMCKDCREEYANPADRRFHAQANACPQCGPEVWLEIAAGEEKSRAYNAICEAAECIKAGDIVAIKGISGIHLAVDANNDDAIKTLRLRKQRPHKPLALMAKDLAQVKRYCKVNLLEAKQLQDARAAIVILSRKSQSDQLAPNQNSLGFMLPYSPLHHLLMQQLDHPIVLTSGNQSSEPQCIDNDDARERLADIADALLLHDRVIENRIDDSVTRYMANEHRILRRARGYTPFPIRLPDADCPDLLAMGAELKNCFCVFKDQQAILSQHMGDLENYATYEDYQKNIQLYTKLYKHVPNAIVVDKHPEYLSSKLGKEWAKAGNIPVIEVQHHHAHIAACLAENQQAMTAPPVLGIALDGLGFGDDGSLWGGEILLADYKQYQRLAHFRPVPLIGGSQAMREPWRNLYAQFYTYELWDEFLKTHSKLAIIDYLKQKPLQTFDKMMEQKLNSPLSSSCGRLFDAVAAAMGICCDHISYEGQAAIEMEALLDGKQLDDTEAYLFDLHSNNGITQIYLAKMWKSLLNDLATETPKYLIAARFHRGLSNILIKLSKQLIRQHGISKVVLTGGVFQNKTLLEAMIEGLQSYADVLTHRIVPANDGGIALGQAAIAAAIYQ